MFDTIIGVQHILAIWPGYGLIRILLIIILIPLMLRPILHYANANIFPIKASCDDGLHFTGLLLFSSNRKVLVHRIASVTNITSIIFIL